MGWGHSSEKTGHISSFTGLLFQLLGSLMGAPTAPSPEASNMPVPHLGPGPAHLGPWAGTPGAPALQQRPLLATTASLNTATGFLKKNAHFI